MDRLLYSVEVVFFSVTSTTLCILVLARNLSKSDSVAIRSMNLSVKPAVAASAMAFAERGPAPDPDYGTCPPSRPFLLQADYNVCGLHPMHAVVL